MPSDIAAGAGRRLGRNGADAGQLRRSASRIDPARAGSRGPSSCPPTACSWLAGSDWGCPPSIAVGAGARLGDQPRRHRLAHRPRDRPAASRRSSVDAVHDRRRQGGRLVPRAATRRVDAGSTRARTGSGQTIRVGAEQLVRDRRRRRLGLGDRRGAGRRRLADRPGAATGHARSIDVGVGVDLRRARRRSGLGRQLRRRHRRRASTRDERGRRRGPGRRRAGARGRRRLGMGQHCRGRPRRTAAESVLRARSAGGARPGRPDRVGPPAPGRRQCRRRARWPTRSATCSSGTASGRASTRSATARATTRPLRRGDFEFRAAAPRTRTPTRTREQLVAVIGPYNSYCATIEIPILNRAPGRAARDDQPVEHATPD